MLNSTFLSLVAASLLPVNAVYVGAARTRASEHGQIAEYSGASLPWLKDVHSLYLITIPYIALS